MCVSPNAFQLRHVRVSSEAFRKRPCIAAFHSTPPFLGGSFFPGDRSSSGSLVVGATCRGATGSGTSRSECPYQIQTNRPGLNVCEVVRKVLIFCASYDAAFIADVVAIYIHGPRPIFHASTKIDLRVGGKIFSIRGQCEVPFAISHVAHDAAVQCLDSVARAARLARLPDSLMPAGRISSYPD